MRNLNIKHILIFVCLLCMGSGMAQYIDPHRYPNRETAARLSDYYYKSKEDYSRMKHLFRDSVSVEEMKAAFYAHHEDTATPPSPYIGRDSVVGVGEYMILQSPLQECPIREARNLRGKWMYYGPLKLIGLSTSDGEKRADILERINKKHPQLAGWFEGDVVMLRYPSYYMGFILSPYPMMLTYGQKRLLHNTSYYGPTDYFSTIGFPCSNEDWKEEVSYGAYYLGQALNERHPLLHSWLLTGKRSFSVLLYDKGGDYDLELLLPRNPDAETLNLFDTMQHFVRRLQRNLFKPYYTSDMRLFAGRYYRVECDRRGWYIEDYVMPIRRL